MCLPEAMDCQIKFPVPLWDTFSWDRGVKKAPQNRSPLFLVAHQNLMVGAIHCYRYTYSSHKTWKNQVVLTTHSFIPAARFYKAGKCCVGCWERKLANSFILLWTSRYSNNWPGKVCIRCNHGMNVISVTNQFLMEIKVHSTRKCKADTVNLTLT